MIHRSSRVLREFWEQTSSEAVAFLGDDGLVVLHRARPVIGPQMEAGAYGR